MSNYLGFEPTKEEEFYFLSYNNDDAERVGKAAAVLCRQIPIWYDFGIPYGDEWEEVISVKIHAAKAVLLFFTPGILHKEESWVMKEFRIAKGMAKKIYVVMMDKIMNEDIPPARWSFWDDITRLQNIEAFRAGSVAQVADIIRQAVSSMQGQETAGKSDETLEKLYSPGQADDSVEKKDPSADDPVGDPSPLLITEETLEPEVKINIVEVKTQGRFFHRGSSKEAMLSIRRENRKQLTQVRNHLQHILDQPSGDVVDAYLCAREAMILVRDQLGAYDWEYNLETGIGNFTSAYENNLTMVKKDILAGKRNLSEEHAVLLGQVLLGLNRLIKTL